MPGTKSSHAISAEQKTELPMQPAINLLHAVFGEQPMMYYLRTAQEKGISKSKDSTVCLLENRIYNKVDVDKMAYKNEWMPPSAGLGFMRDKGIVVGSVSVFQRMYHNNGKFGIPCVEDGLPLSYLTKESYALRDYLIRGSIVVGAGKSEEETRSNLDEAADVLHKTHPLVYFVSYSKLAPESNVVRVKLRSYTPYETEGLIDVAKTLDQISEMLQERTKVQELVTFLRVMQTRHGAQ